MTGTRVRLLRVGVYVEMLGTRVSVLGAARDKSNWILHMENINNRQQGSA